MYYFEDIEKDKILKKELDEWMWTPYRHSCGVKKLGCDCVGVAFQIFNKFNLLNGVTIPKYSIDWHLHKGDEILYNSIKKIKKITELDFQSMMNGDIVLFKYGRVASHLGIYYDNCIYEVLMDRMFWAVKWEDKEKQKRKQFHFRFII